ncbi:hypothetical protein NFI96_005694 [Prochilodus magdalenae]|nr:hypothetical protein NFI96_005694 [Prochilodus magdalenae]
MNPRRRTGPLLNSRDPDLDRCLSGVWDVQLFKEEEGSPVPPSPVHSGSSADPAEAQSTSAASAAAGEEDPCLTPGAPQSSEQDAEPETETEKGETEEEKALRLLYCSLCKVAVNSPSQLEAHNSGTKHKTMLEARNGNGSIKSFPRPGVKNKLTAPAGTTTGLQNKTFHCETCDVHVNSETQLKQHISSRRHKDRAAGKPAKPKYSPYTKTQRGPTKQQTLEHPHTVPADGAVGVEVEGHQAFWTCDNKRFISVLTTVPPHTDSLVVSTKTKAGLVTEDDPLPF